MRRLGTGSGRRRPSAGPRAFDAPAMLRDGARDEEAEVVEDEFDTIDVDALLRELAVARHVAAEDREW